MADDIDKAQEADQRFLGAALAKQLDHPLAGESLTHCTECEEEIPQARRVAAPGCTRCIKCQESFELLTYWRN